MFLNHLALIVKAKRVLHGGDRGRHVEPAAGLDILLLQIQELR
jgi:hypothetical protein